LRRVPAANPVATVAAAPTPALRREMREAARTRGRGATCVRCGADDWHQDGRFFTCAPCFDRRAA